MPELNVTNNQYYELENALSKAGAFDDTTNGIYHTLYKRLKDTYKDDLNGNSKTFAKGTLVYSKEEAPYIIKALENASQSTKSRISSYQYNAKLAQENIKEYKAKIEAVKKDLALAKDSLAMWNTTVKNTTSEVKNIANLIADVKKTNRTTTRAPKATKLPSNATLNRMAKF